MSQATQLLARYLHLARASTLRRQGPVRDRLLVLAGVLANEMNLHEVAAACRAKVLLHNRRHMLRRWPTIHLALGDERFVSLVQQLRRRYSPELVEHMLSSLGVELSNERQLYASDEEYGLALLGQISDASPITSNPKTQAGTDRSISKETTVSTADAYLWLIDWPPYFLGLGALVALTIIHLWRS